MTTIGGVGGFSSAQYARSTFTPPSFESLDSDGNSSLSLEELKSAAPKGASGADAEKRAEALFSAMDSDGNGSITSAEKDQFDADLADRISGSAFMAQQSQGPSLADIFADTDSDGDGSVSLAEFSSDAKDASSDVLSKLFDLIDADGNGSISETESSDFLTQLQGELTAAGGKPGAGGPPPGPPPPGGPPPPQASDDEETAATTTLFSAVQSAYGASQKPSLLDQLASILDAAA